VESDKDGIVYIVFLPVLLMSIVPGVAQAKDLERVSAMQLETQL